MGGLMPRMRVLYACLIAIAVLAHTDGVHIHHHPSRVVVSHPVRNTVTGFTTEECGLIYGLWPLPQSIHCSTGVAIELVEKDFHTTISGAGAANQYVRDSLERMRERLFRDGFAHKTRGPIEPHLQTSKSRSSREPDLSRRMRSAMTLDIIVEKKVDGPKTADSNESYKLDVTASKATIMAAEPWGAIYGLETFIQLAHYDSSASSPVIAGIPLTIVDAPRFPWRGLLLDTANHFIPLADILITIDALAANRMNVFHWHIVDSYSYPMVSQKFPELSSKGAWDSNATYKTSEISYVIEYAMSRGVRVVPELDTPGHAYSLGLAFPNITTSCKGANPDTDIGPINIVPLDPSNEFTYKVVNGLIDEFASIFPDKFLHVGGDELQTDCWNVSESIKRFMHKQNIQNLTALQVYFEKQMLTMVSNKNRRPVIWADSFQEIPSALPQNAVVEVWDNLTLLSEALHAGHDTLLALGWYLDRQQPVENETGWFWLDTWAQMYLVDPEPKTAVDVLALGRVLGGEANMWSEQVSALSLHTRVWPRACAVGERLWSAGNISDTGRAATRLARHRCRMAARGIPVGPIWADYCSADQRAKNIPNTDSTFHDQFLLRTHQLEQLKADIDNDASPLWSLSPKAVGGGAVAFFIISGIILWIYVALNGAKSKSDTSGEAQPLLSKAPVNESTIGSAGDNEAPSQLTGVAVRERVRSLDVFRGLNIALMVFVDMTGSSFPIIHHSPWDGIRLADFVMPFFDFMVGVSMAMSFKKLETTPKKWEARKIFFRKATVRFLKIFLIGVWTQGGISLVEFNLTEVRIMGILQRVAVCYYVTALFKIFFPWTNVSISSSRIGIAKLFARYAWIWFGAAVLMCSHTGIMYGVEVTTVDGMHCGRGNLTVVCNAATYIDRHVLGINHMYFPTNGGSDGRDMTFQRLPECSGCSPGKCVKLNATGSVEPVPEWCNSAPFDPEGLVSSLNAIITTVIGLHYGHVLVHIKDHQMRQMHWGFISVLQLVVGVALHCSGAILMNTDLYSISYLLVSGGAAGIVLMGCYQIVDVMKVGKYVWRPFMYFGMNAIMMYLFMEGDIIDCPLSFFYFKDPDNSLQNILWPTGTFWGDSDDILPTEPSHNPYVMSWTLVYIAFWMVVAWWMHLQTLYVKL